jgi:hypothetical protein
LPRRRFGSGKSHALASAKLVKAYLEAWLAVDERTPALLEVPTVSERYHTAQILDECGEVIVSCSGS